MCFPEPEIMSMFEAATILIEMANSNPHSDDNRKRKMTEIVDFPKPSKKQRKQRKRRGAVRKPARKQKAKEMKLTEIPEMPAAMRERIAEMGGYEVELVIQKQLHDTDLNKNHGRLSVPIKKMRFDFATEEERNLLSKRDERNNKLGIDVTVIDPVLRESLMCLKKWKIGSDNLYCLMTHWNSFVRENALKIGEVVQLWSFRKESHDLCFAITKPNTSLFQ